MENYSWGESAWGISLKDQNRKTERFSQGQRLTNCRISDFSSPTRLYFHVLHDDEDHWRRLQEMNSFYRQKVNIENSDEFDIDREDPFIFRAGQKVVALLNNRYRRALMITGVVTESDKVKLFFVDWGTVAFVSVSSCKHLARSFEDIPAVAYRAAIRGIQPNADNTTKLWPLNLCQSLESSLKIDRVDITILKHHKDRDFYEIAIELPPTSIECETNDVAELLVKKGRAVKSNLLWDPDWPINCIRYPPFEIVEQLDYYPTLKERLYLLREKNIDFNAFEESAIHSSVCDKSGLELAEAVKSSFKANFEWNQRVYEGFKELIRGNCPC